MTTEEMRKELEAAGYQFIANGYFAKDDTYTFRYEGEEVGSLNESIGKAYVHLTTSRKASALRDYLLELERNLNIATNLAKKQGYDTLIGVGIHFTASDIERLKELLD